MAHTPNAAPTEIFDFSKDYSLIGEPLNLHEAGQLWFRRIHAAHLGESDLCGVVLGATPWMVDLLRRSLRHVVVIDMNARMLEIAEKNSQAGAAEEGQGTLTFVEGDWLRIPELRHPIDFVLADNSFSFRPFPDGWRNLCEHLAKRMRKGGTLMTRFLSVPPSHRTLPAVEIAARFRDHEPINYTEVRASLLFSQWKKANCAIDTEKAYEAFAGAREAFDELLRIHRAPLENDLVTIRKYKTGGAVYYAPPLADALEVIGSVFKVTSVHFGPYALPHYFPLVVAKLE